MSSLFFGDYDNNGLSEIYSFTVNNDSVFVNGMEFKSELRVVDNLFVCMANKYQGDLDIAISAQLRENQFLDLTNDGFKELLLNYQALYSGTPRVLYALNIENNTFTKSEPTGAYLRIDALIDLDNDGQKEIICGSSSPANNKPDSSLFLHDYS